MLLSGMEPNFSVNVAVARETLAELRGRLTLTLQFVVSVVTCHIEFRKANRSIALTSFLLFGFRRKMKFRLLRAAVQISW